MASGVQHQKLLPVVTPGRPLALKAGEWFADTMTLGDDFTGAAMRGFTVRARLHVDLPAVSDPLLVEARFNGEALAGEGRVQN